MGRKAHALLATGDHDVSIAGRNLLRAESDGAEPRAAHLVHAEGGRFHWDAGGDGGLTRRVLALGRCQHLAHDHFVDIGRSHARPIERRLDGNLAERMRRQGRQRAVERANRRPRRADDDNILVFHTHLQHLREGRS